MDSCFNPETPLSTFCEPQPEPKSNPIPIPNPKIDQITEYLGLTRKKAMNSESAEIETENGVGSNENDVQMAILENGINYHELDENGDGTNHVRGLDSIDSESSEGVEPLEPLPPERKRKKKKKRRRADNDAFPTANGFEALPEHEQVIESESLLINILNDPTKVPVKLTMFKDMFNCGDCGEVFYSEEGLEDHRNRVTIQAYVRCPYCENEKGPKRIYYNRCRLLNHFKSHGVELSVVNLLGHINIQTLKSEPPCYDYSLPIVNKSIYPTCTITSEGMEVDEDEPEPPEPDDYLDDFMGMGEDLEVDQLETSSRSHPSSTPRRNGYTQKKVKCHFCDYKVPVRNLKKHQKYCDPNSEQTDYYCNVCTKVFTGNSGYLNHSIQHLQAGLKICMFCYNTDIGDEDLDQHLALHVDVINDLPYDCPLCSVSIDQLTEIEAHFKNHHIVERKNRFKCAVCGGDFDDVKQLVQHRQQHDFGLLTPQRAQTSKTNGNKTPSPSSKNFSSVSRQSAKANLFHVPIPNDPKNKPKTPAPTPVQSHNYSHKSNYTYVYTCKYCSRVKPFMTCQGLRKHIKTHHPRVDITKVEWTKMRKITKESELKGIESRSVVVVNGQNHEQSSLSIYPKSDARPLEGIFNCLKCNDGTELESETSFYDHIKMSHICPAGGIDHINYWCPECGLEFFAQMSFKMHLQSEHPFIRNVTKYMENIGYINSSSSVFKRPFQKSPLLAE